MTTRVAVQVQAVVETYDADGNLLTTQPTQPVSVAAMSRAALDRGMVALAAQLADLFGPAPVALPQNGHAEEPFDLDVEVKTQGSRRGR